MLIALVIGVTAGIFIFRYAATSGKWKSIFTVNGVSLGGAAASTINAVQIMVLNTLYGGMAIKLNNFGEYVVHSCKDQSSIALTR